MAPPAANSSSSVGGGGGGSGSGSGAGGAGAGTSSSTANAAATANTNNNNTSSGGAAATTTTNLSGTKRKSSTKSSHSRSYPRGVGLDFRKLAGLTLISYIDHHGVKVRSEAPPSELAVAVARHFESFEVEEEQCVGGFLERLEVGSSATTDYARNTQHNYIGGDYTTTGAIRGSNTSNNANAGNNIKQRNKRTKWAARPGEQVAAKVTRTDENGSWILASVQRFYPDTETYDVQDEDDTSKLIRLPWSHVMRLSTGSEGCFNARNTDCMAIFPETTSFYKAKVSKAPVWKLDHGVPTVKEIIVKFDDDEDSATGKTPHRRVPARYVIPVPSEYFYDESEDVDLDPPTRTPILASSTGTTTTATTTNNAAAAAVVGLTGVGGPSSKNSGKK